MRRLFGSWSSFQDWLFYLLVAGGIFVGAVWGAPIFKRAFDHWLMGE